MLEEVNKRLYLLYKVTVLKDKNCICQSSRNRASPLTFLPVLLLEAFP